MDFELFILKRKFAEQFYYFFFVAIVVFSGLPSQNSAINTPKDGSIHIREMHVSSKIRYRYCRTHVISTIVNSHPENAQEINFFMKIPRNAFISNLTLETESGIYPAFVEKREEASLKYGTAIDHSHTAVLVAAENSDSKMFNVSLNIESNSEVKVILSYEEQIIRENGHYVYRIYMHPGQMEIVKDFTVTIDMIEFYNISSIQIPNLNTGKMILELDKLSKSINGTKAFLSWTPGQNRTFYDKLVSEGVLGDFSIHYYLEHNSKPGKVLLRNGYFVHTFNTQDLPILPKHVIFVLDISGSMMGLRLKQLQSAMKNIFDDLRTDDFFNIITFSSQVQNWSPFGGKCSNEVIPFSHDFKNMAIDSIDNLEVHGSTNINGALEEALGLSRKLRNMRNNSCILPNDYDKFMNSNVTTMILFLTDGEPTSGFIHRPQILENIKIRNSRYQIPIFSLAFGAEADFYFVQKLSLQNHGFSRRVYEGIDSDKQLEKFYAEISSPVLSDVIFLYTSPLYNISHVTFHRFSMINKNSEIQIAGIITPKYKLVDIERNNSTIPLSEVFSVSSTKFIDATMVCQCNFCDKNDEFISADTEYNRDHGCRDEEDYFMERRWAYISIMNLIDSLKAEENATVREKIVNMSLHYHFVTPYTSLVYVKPNRNEQSKTEINIDTEIDDLEKYKNSVKMYSPTRRPTRPRKPITLLSAPIPNPTPSPLPKKYNLTDIIWLESHKVIVIRLGLSASVELHLIQNNQEDKGSYQNCKVPGNRPGKCKHLKDCVVKEILTDFDLFRTSYFCPIYSGQHGNFIGTCCEERAIR